MSESVAYTVGRLHGLRGLQQHPYLFPADSWEGRQYKQGYIDGAVALENDIVCEKTLLNLKKR
jgi:hypothetical protein